MEKYGESGVNPYQDSGYYGVDGYSRQDRFGRKKRAHVIVWSIVGSITAIVVAVIVHMVLKRNKVQKVPDAPATVTMSKGQLANASLVSSSILKNVFLNVCTSGDCAKFSGTCVTIPESTGPCTAPVSMCRVGDMGATWTWTPVRLPKGANLPNSRAFTKAYGIVGGPIPGVLSVTQGGKTYYLCQDWTTSSLAFSMTITHVLLYGDTTGNRFYIGFPSQKTLRVCQTSSIAQKPAFTQSENYGTAWSVFSHAPQLGFYVQMIGR